MINIAILGFGIVGGGIPYVLEHNKNKIEKAIGDSVSVKYILDKRDFPEDPLGDRVIHDIDRIVSDPDVKLVAETMGGSHPAFEFSMAALRAGKHVVTSNKEVVANYGDQLLACAKENGVQYLFEASVGGGIPIIRGIRAAFAGEEIASVHGILNGTTNYILSGMYSDGASFEDALRQAQANGYAEANPSADVDGIDAQRKIAILTALSFGELIDPSTILTRTMTTVSSADIAAAKNNGYVIKYIGGSRKIHGKIEIFAAPFFVANDNPLASVNGVNNSICVSGSIAGDYMFYGPGAGRYPTAGAVVSDITSALSGADAALVRSEFHRGSCEVISDDDIRFPFYVRTAGETEIPAGCKTCIAQDGFTEFITAPMNEKEITALAEKIGAESFVRVFKR